VPYTAGRREATIAVTAPLEGKFLYAVALFLCPHYDFYIERKPIGDAFAIQVPCNIALVYLKSALRVG